MNQRKSCCELLGRAGELIAAQRLAVGETLGQQQRVGEFRLLDLDAEHDDAVTQLPTIGTLSSTNPGRLCPSRSPPCWWRTTGSGWADAIAQHDSPPRLPSASVGRFLLGGASVPE
jgi:hypothetical protein